MSTSLFRQEAIDYQRFRIWGEVTIALPKFYALVTSFITLSVLAMTLFIATHSYARKEHATGFLVATEGIARIFPPRGGTITVVHVSEGQHVERGAPLLSVTDVETSATPLDGFNTGFIICGVIMLVGGTIAMALIRTERDAMRWASEMPEVAVESA